MYMKTKILILFMLLPLLGISQAVQWFTVPTLIQVNMIKNGGSSNTTDWLNPTDGLAEFWGHDFISGTRTFSIVTGNGFTGNAQRFEFTHTSAQGSTILQDAADFLTPPSVGPKKYTLIFKYRLSDTSISGDGLTIWVHYTDASIDEFGSFIENTGDAISASTSVNTDSGKTIEFLVFNINCAANETSWLEIDEVNMGESDIN